MLTECNQCIRWFEDALDLFVGPFCGIWNEGHGSGFKIQSAHCSIHEAPDGFVVFHLCLVAPHRFELCFYSALCQVVLPCLQRSRIISLWVSHLLYHFFGFVFEIFSELLPLECSGPAAFGLNFSFLFILGPSVSKSCETWFSVWQTCWCRLPT